MDAFRIERCTDASRLAELHRFVHGIFGALPIDPPSSVLKETLDDFAARLRTDVVFLALAGPELIGSVFCTPKPDELYIGRLAVRPDWRRRGVASALVEAARAEANARSASRMTLGARIALPGNVVLFQRHGFVITAATAHQGFTQPTSYDMELALARMAP